MIFFVFLFVLSVFTSVMAIAAIVFDMKGRLQTVPIIAVVVILWVVTVKQGKVTYANYKDRIAMIR